MPYIGHNPTQAGSFVLLDDIASGFDGSDVTFTLQIGGVDITPTADNLIIALDGVIQHSPEAYSVSGSTLTFTAAPASGVDFYGMLMGQSASIGQGSIGADELAVTGDGSANQMLVSDGDGTMTWKGSGLSATSATGDLIYRNSSGELARLAVGSSGQVLTVASGVPAWETDVESYLPLSGGTMSGALNMNSQNITNGGTITGTFSGNLTGNVTGNTSGTAATVTGASQSAITSVGTLTGLTVSGDVSIQDNSGAGNLTLYGDPATLTIDSAGSAYHHISKASGGNWGALVISTGANANSDSTWWMGLKANSDDLQISNYQFGTNYLSISKSAGATFSGVIKSQPAEGTDATLHLDASGNGNAQVWIDAGTSTRHPELSFRHDGSNYWTVKSDPDRSNDFCLRDDQNSAAIQLRIAQSSGNATFGGTIESKGSITLGSTGSHSNLLWIGSSNGTADIGMDDGYLRFRTSSGKNMIFQPGDAGTKLEIETDGTVQFSGTATFQSNATFAEYLKHDGDSDTYMRFTPDQISFTTGNAEHFRIENTITRVLGANATFEVQANATDPAQIRLLAEAGNYDRSNWFLTANKDSPYAFLIANGDYSFMNFRGSDGTVEILRNTNFGEAGGLENTRTGSRVEINGSWGDPNHGNSSNTKSILRVAGGGHSNTLDFGCNSTSPYNLWIQGTNRGTSGGNAGIYALDIQPKGGKTNFGGDITGPGQWEVVERIVLSSDTTGNSGFGSNTCFASNDYVAFKLIIGWIQGTAGGELRWRFSNASGTVSANQYYGTSSWTHHGNTSYNANAENAVSEMMIWEHLWTDENRGGVHGEIDVYNVSGPTISGTDCSRGGYYRPYMAGYLVGYDSSGSNAGYGKMTFDCRYNNEETAANWKGFFIWNEGGNLKAKSHITVLGLRA